MSVFVIHAIDPNVMDWDKVESEPNHSFITFAISFENYIYTRIIRFMTDIRIELTVRELTFNLVFVTFRDFQRQYLVSISSKTCLHFLHLKAFFSLHNTLELYFVAKLNSGSLWEPQQKIIGYWLQTCEPQHRLLLWNRL